MSRNSGISQKYYFYNMMDCLRDVRVIFDFYIKFRFIDRLLLNLPPFIEFS